MSKLSRKELDKIEAQMKSAPKRGDTWTGFRPVTFIPKELNKKVRRREDREICNNYNEEEYDDYDY